MDDPIAASLAATQDAFGLPADCYLSPAFFAREVQRIHLRHWLFAGRADELPEPGSYRAIETVGGPALLVRDEAGAIRAFANTCRHRGAELLAGAGQCRHIICPYHGWSYGQDGALLAAPGMRGVAGFDTDAHGLLPIRLEAWAGFLFLNYDDDAAPLKSHLGDMPDVFASHALDDMACTWRHEIVCGCNWKLLLENAMETYHTGLVHAATVGAQRSVTHATRGEWLAIQVLSGTSIAVLGDAPPPFPPIPGLDEQARRGTYFTVIHPTTQFAVAQDCMWWLAVRPLAADRTVLSIGGCFPRTTTALPDFAAKAEGYYERWRRVAEEDVGILESQQRGLGSAKYRPGRLSWRDDVVHRLGKWVMEQMRD